MRYAETKRMLFIYETLELKGFINRGDLVKKFEISWVQSSKDFRKFKEKYPKAMEYNLSKRRYEKTNLFGKEEI